MPTKKSVKFSNIPRYAADALPEFIQRWKDGIESGQPPEVMARAYHPTCLLKGTISNRTVQGHEAVKQYFKAFVEDKNALNVHFNTLSRSPAGSFSGEYVFHWTDDNGAEHSAKANYTFESAKWEGREVIGLHHSSFEPDQK
jgi:hypothetical protein